MLEYARKKNTAMILYTYQVLVPWYQVPGTSGKCRCCMQAAALRGVGSGQTEKPRNSNIFHNKTEHQKQNKNVKTILDFLDSIRSSSPYAYSWFVQDSSSTC